MKSPQGEILVDKAPSEYFTLLVRYKVSAASDMVSLRSYKATIAFQS